MGGNIPKLLAQLRNKAKGLSVYKLHRYIAHLHLESSRPEVTSAKYMHPESHSVIFLSYQRRFWIINTCFKSFEKISLAVQRSPPQILKYILEEVEVRNQLNHW